ncbi:MAG: hypothetical protein KDB22_17730 [Planctomycetales bacterium]|nr:hypothetical protein [Planctomycetales bacterium]
MRNPFLNALTIAVLLVANCVSTGWAQWEGERFDSLLKDVEKTFGDPRGMVRLDPKSRIWADKKSKRVVVDGYVALRQGQLEMLACIAATKEHESVVAVFSKAQWVHAGLIAVGAKPGTPVKWEPEYQPPTGSKIQVIALWKDAEGKKQVIDAREWVREVGTSQSLQTNFVFAGSIMWKDPDTGEEFYQAEDGDLVCVANFSTATMDIPLRSLSANAVRSFEAYTDKIPESGTPVRLVFEVIDDELPPAKAAASDQPTPTEKDGSSRESSKPKISLAAYERLIDSPEEVASATLRQPVPAAE